MRIVLYSQHVLGVGHFFRTLELAKGLAPDEVVLVTGGAEIDFTPPANVRHVQLPGIMMDEEFSKFIPMQEGATIEETLEIRREQLLELMETEQPDIFLVELYPFGRKKFGFELDPVLENIKAGKYGECKAVCSVRDILVEKKDQAKFEERVLDRLNRLFDALLIHSDPVIVRLKETFPAFDRIEIPTHYTGYVTPRPDPDEVQALADELDPEEDIILVSAGGGNVGHELLEATLQASEILVETMPHRLVLFTGPYAPDDVYEKLTSMAENMEHAEIRRFTKRFPAWLANSSLSVSMAGYNTTMNLLAAEAFGLMLPFAQNREQKMRAMRLEQRGVLGLLAPNELDPEWLFKRMRAALGREPRYHTIDLDGAAKSAEIIREL